MEENTNNNLEILTEPFTLDSWIFSSGADFFSPQSNYEEFKDTE